MSKKLERIPYAHNWVRYVYPTVEETVTALLQFARHIPKITYVAGQKAVQDRVRFGIDRETALGIIAHSGHVRSRPYSAEYVNAFFDWEGNEELPGLPSFVDEIQPFRISKGLYVPVKPTVVVSKNGVLEPVVSVGWRTLGWTPWQLRLQMTVFEDALFSLEDYRKSKGLFCAFPMNGIGKNAVRQAETWARGDYILLSKVELRDAVEIYLEALRIAKAILASEAPAQRKPAEPSPTPSDHYPNQPLLPF